MGVSPDNRPNEPAMLRFADAARNRHFRENGYAVFPLLDADSVNRLTDYWRRIDDPACQRPYALSLTSSNAALRREASDLLASIIGPLLAPILPDAEFVFGGFAEKRANEPASGLSFHQDPSFVDEAEWGAGNIWIPLVDIEPDNGPLYIVAGSHLCPYSRRGFNQGFAFAGNESALTALATPLFPRAGEAIMFAHSLFHFSPPNRSPRPRPAAANVVAQRGAPLHYNYADPADRSRVHVFPATPSTFLEVPITARPLGEPAKIVPTELARLEPDDLRRLAALKACAEQRVGIGRQLEDWPSGASSQS